MNFVRTQINNSTGDGKDAVLESVDLILVVNDDINAALNNINDGLESVQYDSVIKDVDNFETIRLSLGPHPFNYILLITGLGR